VHCSKGFQQEYDLDFDEVFSTCIVKMTTLRSKSAEGTATIVLRFAGFFNGTLNGGDQPSVEPRSPAAATWIVPISRSRAPRKGRGKSVPTGSTVHIVLAVWALQCGVRTVLCTMPSQDAHDCDVRI
jgi:hypothetical protein